MALQQQQQQQQPPRARPLRACRGVDFRGADFVAMSDLEFERCLDASPPAKRARAESLGPKYRTVTLRLRGVSDLPSDEEEYNERMKNYDPAAWMDWDLETDRAACSLMDMSKALVLGM